MFDVSFQRGWWVAVALSAVGIGMHDTAAAASPPSMPLPPCTEVDGQQQGACPSTSEDVTGQASGSFSANSTVMITTVPTNGVCVSHTGYPPYPWNPSPCYSAVSSPSVVTCAVIDLQDGGRFREMSCGQALYKNPQDAPTPMFTLQRADGEGACNARGNFQTYGYGGPANVPGARWSEFGPPTLECNATFNGARPDGLYGPTWVKMRVGIEQAENGDERRGYSRSAEIYVPIDGDMREQFIDVDVMATGTLSGSGDNVNATYTATLTNLGGKDAENITLTVTLPPQLHFVSVSDSRCRQGGSSPFVGGNVVCSGLSLAGTGHALGNDVEFIDIETRVINTADLETLVVMLAEVADDIDTSNNENSVSTRPTLSSGSVGQTRQAMEALRPYFDYKTPDELLDQQCNVYMDDIYERLQAIHQQAPEVFANLSYGKVTSGDYYWAPAENSLTRAGHVGVVVYLKGTNYHETGVIIHGTPTWSPTDLDIDSAVGSMEVGYHINSPDFAAGFVQQGTQGHGWYYSTPVNHFPGSPTVEGIVGCGFEGAYPDNADEFERVPNACKAEPVMMCPAYPDAVMVQTESPVDILASNPQGQRVETRGGRIFVQELDSGIHSFATPHEDGTYGWTLVLPPDDYDIQLLGTGEGPYKLTLTTFDEQGEAVEQVFEGVTESGQVNEYELAGAVAQDPGPGPGTGGSANSGGKKGGGSFGWLALLMLGPMLLLGRRRSFR